MEGTRQEKSTPTMLDLMDAPKLEETFFADIGRIQN